MLNFTTKKFDELSLRELYNIMQLRQEVFIVEQNCPYLDADGKDFYSLHLAAYESGNMVAYCRLLPAGLSYTETSIGRVITANNTRGKGYGKLLMAKAIEEIQTRFGNGPIKIGAQAYLKKFYESFGFIDLQEPYLEDGIPHLIMLRE